MLTGKRIISQANAATDYLTLSEAKSHLRVTSSSDDSYIAGLIGMAFDACGQYLGYNVIKSTVRYGFDGFVGLPSLINPVNGLQTPSGNYLRIPSRVLSLEHVYYINESNALTEFDAADWISAPDPLGNYGRDIFFNSAPSSLTDDRTRYLVECIEGFELTSATTDLGNKLPLSVKHAALLLVGQYYDNRSSVTSSSGMKPLDFGLKYMLDPYRLEVFV